MSGTSGGGYVLTADYIDLVFDSPSCASATLHVASVSVIKVKDRGPNNFGRATVVVQDNCGYPVSGVLVSGDFSGLLGGSASAVTDATGTAVMQTSGSAKGSTPVTFCVSGLQLTGYTYASGDNIVTCGSSN